MEPRVVLGWALKAPADEGFLALVICRRLLAKSVRGSLEAALLCSALHWNWNWPLELLFHPLIQPHALLPSTKYTQTISAK